MKFMYLGEGETTIFGYTFKAGEAVEVTDARAIGKLKNMATLFAHDEEPAPKVDEPVKRRGRPPNAN